MASAPKIDIPCEGWWQQPYFGRQPMHDLRLRFETGQLTGAGYDIIGLFTLHGTISADGLVHMRKQYLGQHAVEYVGRYDGEGLLYGEWHIGPAKDRWLIKLIRSVAREPADVQTLEVVSDFDGKVLPAELPAS